MTYLLDTNVFIQAKRRYYGLDFCPAFWGWLVEKNNAGKAASIAAVREEIRVGEDELTKWANERDDKFFRKADDKVFSTFKEISNWVVHESGYKKLLAILYWRGLTAGLSHTRWSMTRSLSLKNSLLTRNKRLKIAKNPRYRMSARNSECAI